MHKPRTNPAGKASDPKAVAGRATRPRIARDPFDAGARQVARAALVAARRGQTPAERAAGQATLLEHLEALLGDVGREVVGVYWPVRGEPDLAPLLARWVARGVRLALPVVRGAGQPLAFVGWAPGDATRPGAFGIAEPAAGESVRPTVLVVPCLGFGPQGHRLGYGGGFYDRTLAAWDADGARPPLAIGVAWDHGFLPGFEPLPTDRPLAAVVTPSGVRRGVRPPGR